MSLEKLERHRALWQSKPLLRDVYQVWFDSLLGALPPAGRVLELGAGPGLFSAYARQRQPQRRWVATDILPAPWNDVTADGLRLPFRDAAFDAVVGLDFVHHLARPAVFFRETARVLRSGGPLALLEPWVSPFSFPIYRWLHQEGCRLSVDPWNPFGTDVGEAKDAFEGDAAVLWRLLRAAPQARWRELGLLPPRVARLNGFAYVSSLGFRPGALLPRRLGRVLLAVDQATRPLAALFGMRALAVWQRL